MNNIYEPRKFGFWYFHFDATFFVEAKIPREVRSFCRRLYVHVGSGMKSGHLSQVSSMRVISRQSFRCTTVKTVCVAKLMQLRWLHSVREAVQRTLNTLLEAIEMTSSFLLRYFPPFRKYHHENNSTTPFPVTNTNILHKPLKLSTRRSNFK